MSTEKEECVLCSSNNITDLGRAFTYFEGTTDYRKSAGEKLNIDDSEKTHVMCDQCLKDFIRVCTCEKPFKSEPTTLTVLYPNNSVNKSEGFPEIVDPVDKSEGFPEIEDPVDKSEGFPEIEDPVDKSEGFPDIKDPVDKSEGFPEIVDPVDKEITRTYFDIDHEVFLDLLSHWNEEYYIIECCRGCQYKTLDIQTDVKIGLQAAIEACVYKKFDISSEGTSDDEKNQKYSAMAYQSDALDDDFVKEVAKYGVDLGSGTEL
jgi:hypothetical protein